MPGVEQRRPVFGSKVEGILREVVFSRGEAWGGTGDVEGRDIIERL